MYKSAVRLISIFIKSTCTLNIFKDTTYFFFFFFQNASFWQQAATRPTGTVLTLPQCTLYQPFLVKKEQLREQLMTWVAQGIVFTLDQCKYFGYFGF